MCAQNANYQATSRSERPHVSLQGALSSCATRGRLSWAQISCSSLWLCLLIMSSAVKDEIVLHQRGVNMLVCHTATLLSLHVCVEIQQNVDQDYFPTFIFFIWLQSLTHLYFCTVVFWKPAQHIEVLNRVHPLSICPLHHGYSLFICLLS